MKNNLLVVGSDYSLAKYLGQIKSVPMLSEEEEYSLAIKWRDEKDIKAAQRLILSHLRLVIKVAQKFRGYGLPIADLISEGSIGLMKAVKKFDPDKGYRLSTYAIWWIKATIQEYVLKSWSLVKIGSSALQKKLFFNLKKVKQQLMDSDLDTDISTAAAERLGVDRARFEDMDRTISSNLTASCGSVYDDEGDNNGDAIMNIASSEDLETQVIDAHDRDLMLKKLVSAMNKLSERERDILIARNLTNPPKTLESLSVKYNISTERVRQVGEAALKKLKNDVAISN
jgi:RNA polymerase sigma-32 factor